MITRKNDMRMNKALEISLLSFRIMDMNYVCHHKCSYSYTYKLVSKLLSEE